MSSYKKGRRIRSITDFNTSAYKMFVVKFGDTEKVLHRGFLISWQYRMLCQVIGQGRIYEAERRKHEENKGDCNTNGNYIDGKGRKGDI